MHPHTSYMGLILTLISIIILVIGIIQQNIINNMQYELYELRETIESESYNFAQGSTLAK